MAQVLVVEDEAHSLELLTQWFEDRGDRVVAVRSGAAALEQAARFAPELLLVDYFLPGGPNGLEVAQRLRTWHPALSVLLMTGMLLGPFARDLLERESIAVLQKPFSFRTLAASLDALTLRNVPLARSPRPVEEASQ